MVDVNLAVVSGKRIIQAESLESGSATPASIKAVKNARYVLTEGDKMIGPELVSVKRVGNNLWVLLPGSDAEHPQLIIENYYQHPGEIVGLAEDGSWHAYVSANADRGQDPAALQDGELSAVLFDSQPTIPLTNLTADSNIMGLGLIALGAAAAVTALALLTQSHSSNDDSAPPPPEEQPATEPTPEVEPPAEELGEEPSTELPAEEPTVENLMPEAPPAAAPSAEDLSGDQAAIASAQNVWDDVGDEQGNVASGNTTDDNLPTLSGNGLQPDSVIDVRDNGSLLGTTTVDALGNWSFTPQAPLNDGLHAFDVVITDPQGAVSEPSDPTIVNIVTLSLEPETAPLSLDDLLPSGSDFSDWALMSLPDDAPLNYDVIPAAHDANAPFDEMLNSNYPI